MSDLSKATADPPLISITLQPTTLRLGVAILFGAALLIVGWLGIASSPIVDGHPVLLSPERLAIKTYLEAAATWVQQLNEIDQRLATIEVARAISPKAEPIDNVLTVSPIVSGTALSITVPPAIPLPTLAAPAHWPDNLYDRVQQADRLVRDLAAIDADLQQIEVPPALNALHELARSTLQAFARWSTAALDVIGAPVPDNVAALQSSRETAHTALAAFRSALETQRQEAR
jgi:hypothetical protein